MKLYMFRTVPVSIIKSFSLYTHSNGICHRGLLAACEQEQMLLLTSCQQTSMTYTIAVCVQWKTLDDGHRNCLKHVEFHFKNKFQKLVHLVGFIIRNGLINCILQLGRKGCGWFWMELFDEIKRLNLHSFCAARSSVDNCWLLMDWVAFILTGFCACLSNVTCTLDGQLRSKNCLQ